MASQPKRDCRYNVYVDGFAIRQDTHGYLSIYEKGNPRPYAYARCRGYMLNQLQWLRRGYRAGRKSLMTNVTTGMPASSGS